MKTKAAYTPASDVDKKTFLKALLEHAVVPPKEIIELILKKPHMYLSGTLGRFRPAFTKDISTHQGDRQGEIALNSAKANVMSDGLILEEQLPDRLPDCIIMLISTRESADVALRYLEQGTLVIGRVNFKSSLPLKIQKYRGGSLHILDEHEIHVSMVENLLRNALFSIKEKLRY